MNQATYNEIKAVADRVIDAMAMDGQNADSSTTFHLYSNQIAGIYKLLATLKSEVVK